MSTTSPHGCSRTRDRAISIARVSGTHRPSRVVASESSIVAGRRARLKYVAFKSAYEERSSRKSATSSSTVSRSAGLVDGGAVAEEIEGIDSFLVEKPARRQGLIG